MRVIVLGGGVVGVTTAFFLLQDGHEVTVVERQPGVARECSHANGGFVAISQAVPWSAPGVPVKTLTTMTRPDAPILIHGRQLLRISRWGLDFLLASRAKPSWANTQAVLQLALYSLDALTEIRATTALDYDRVTGGALKVYSDQKSLDEAIVISERQRPLGLEFRVLDRKAACLALVPALTPRIDSLAGGIHFEGEEGGDCFKFCERLAACAARHSTILLRSATPPRARRRPLDQGVTIAFGAGTSLPSESAFSQASTSSWRAKGPPASAWARRSRII